MNSSLKPFLYCLFGGLLLSLVSLVIWIAVNGSQGTLLFGRVVDVSGSTITIADRQNNQTVIPVASSTSVTRNRDDRSLADIQINNFVQVTIAEEENVAESIRLLRRPRDNNYHGASQ